MKFQLITAPTIEPVQLEEQKTHCRIIGNADDKYVEALIIAARQKIENILSRALITQTWEMYFNSLSTDDWICGGEILIPRPPLQSITSFKYYDADNVLQTWDAANYQYDTKKEPARLRPVYGVSYPSIKTGRYNAATIQFKAGYGDKPEAVPFNIRQAIMMIAAELYERREQAIVGAPIASVNVDIGFLIDDERIFY